MALTAKKVYAILKRQISDMEAKLNSPVRYRGTVATADLLPLNPDIGDMYNIESKSIYGEAGMNVAWNGVVWDTMGAPIDMSLYIKSSELADWAKQQDKPTYTAEEVGALPADTKIPSKTSDLQNDSGFLTKIPDNYLSGTDKTLSVSGKAADAKATGDKITELSTDISNKLNKNQGSENSGKIAGINESGDIVPMFPVSVDYNEETNCLEFGSDQKMELNKGINLDSTLTKAGYAADAGAVGEITDSLKEDIANTASVTFTYDPSKNHSSTLDKINLSTKKGELYTLYVTNNKNLTSNLLTEVYEYNGKTGNSKEERLPFFSARSFVSNGCDSVGIWMPQNMFAESCEVTFTLKRELYEKIEDIYNKIDGFSQGTDGLYLPSIVNGSIQNKQNESCISVNEIIPTNGVKTIKIYTTIPLPNGYRYHYNLATYKNSGNPREEKIVNFVDGYVKAQDNPTTFDVSGFDYFAFDFYIIENSSDYKNPIRMSNNIVGKPFLISYEYQIDKFAMSDEIIKMERGLIDGGKYPTSVNKQYIRSKSIMKVNKGDCLTIDVSDKLSGGYQYNLYKYSNADENAIVENQLINNMANPKSKTIHFDENCYISIRATLVPVHDLTDEEVNIFLKLFSIRRNSVCSDIDELHSSVNAIKKQMNGYDGFLNIDYNTLKNEMNGNINIAVQTDTHACAFDTYKNNGEKVYPSNFETFRTVLNTIEKLGCDVTTNLGDIVQGYEFDADFETRESLKKIIQTCSETLTQKPLYVIGNHDDGNLFYYDTRYNDKKDVSNVLYPYEQFQRITKNGVNGKNNNNYYYADIKGIRFITLYQRDFNYSEKIPNIEEFCISQTQIEWFKNDALNTTNPIIVLTHAPLVSELFTTGGTGFTEILTALQTFKANGGIIIAVLNGHTHKQDHAVVNGINHIVFANGYSFFEIMSVDLNTKAIKCKPINNSALQERTFSY